MQKKTMMKDLTSGSVVKLLFAFALPLFVSNALQAVYNLIDMVIVGQYIGANGMSAVSVGGDILHLITFVAMGFSSAGQVLISQSVGAGRTDRVRRIIGTMFTVLLSFALVLSVFCWLIRANILSWLNVKADYYDFTMDYTVTCVIGLVFIYGYNIVSAILRGMGDSQRPFVFIAIAAVLNTVLDVVFVKYMDMKVFGAALATVIGQGVSFVISIIYLYVKRENFGFDFKPSSFRVSKEELIRLIALGVPMAIQSAAISFSKIVLSAWINRFDVVYTAMGGLYNKINMMAGIVSNSFTAAGSAMIGQNLGAKKYERVPVILRTVFVIGIIMSVAAAILLRFFSNELFELFTTDAAVLAGASILVLPTTVNLFGSATRSVAFAIINGSGNTKLNLAVALIDGLISRMGIAAVLGFVFGLDCLGFWLGDAIAGFVPICVGMAYYLSGKWRKASY